jgi:hypothetical protein
VVPPGGSPARSRVARPGGPPCSAAPGRPCLYHYIPGQAFKAHRDGAYRRTERREESELTYMVYLNGDVDGGETRSYADMAAAFLGRPCLAVAPQEGEALVFGHRLWHGGAAVRGGCLSGPGGGPAGLRRRHRGRRPPYAACALLTGSWE